MDTEMAFEWAAYQVGNTPLRTYPFPHVYVEEVFPWEFYWDLVASWPTAIEGMSPDEGASNHRYYKRTHITESFMRHEGLAYALAHKLGITYGGPVGIECRLVRDLPEYHVDPHTDSSGKLASILFYMPQGKDSLGTSLYLPKDRALTSKESDGPGHDHFDLIHTFTRKPNSALVLKRTDNSWHGVEPTKRIYYRDSIIYMLYKA